MPEQRSQKKSHRSLLLACAGFLVIFFGLTLLLPQKAEAALGPSSAVTQALAPKTFDAPEVKNFAESKPTETAQPSPPTSAATTSGTIQARPIDPASTQSARIVAPTSVVDTNITTDPATSGTPRTQIPPKPPPKQKWVVVDISEQRIYFYEDGKIVRSNLVSTGMPGTPTNLGTQYVWLRVYNETMSGPGYYLENVYFTQYFNSEGEALHYAWWHNNFGRPMSHGCVNMDWSTSKFAWYWAPPRLKVIVRN